MHWFEKILGQKWLIITKICSKSSRVIDSKDNELISVHHQETWGPSDCFISTGREKRVHRTPGHTARITTIGGQY